jgi:hypothetical protein
MRRITISLPEDLAAALERESQREHTSVSEIARRAIEAKLRRLPIVDGKRVIPFAGIGSSDGKGPFAADMEEYLRKEWTIDRDRG